MNNKDEIEFKIEEIERDGVKDRKLYLYFRKYKKQIMYVALSVLLVAIIITSLSIAFFNATFKNNNSTLLDTPSPSTKSPIVTDKPIPEGVYIHYADLTHDGVDEKIVVDMGKFTGYGTKPEYDYKVEVYDLRYDKRDPIWSYPIDKFRGYRRGVYLYEQDGLHYLMAWEPYLTHGKVDLYYEVFSFSYREPYYQEETFDSGNLLSGEYYEEEQIRNSFDKAKYYINNSYVLLDTFNKECFSKTGELIKNPNYKDNWFSNYCDRMIEDSVKFFEVTYADVTHDGIDEKIVVDKRNKDIGPVVRIYNMSENENGEVIWDNSWRPAEEYALFLYKEDDKYYLLNWNTSLENNGLIDHTFYVFKLNSNGEVQSQDNMYIRFDKGYRAYNYTNISDIIDFYYKARGYLLNSTEIIDLHTYWTPDNKESPTALDVCSKEWYLNALGIDASLVKENVPMPSIVTKVKENLKYGMSRQDVHKLLAPTKAVELKEMEWDFMFIERYDFSRDESYEFNDFKDYVNYNGLIKGEVDVILFVTYDSENKDKVEKYSMFYTDGDKIGELRMENDGLIESVVHDINKLLKG